MRRSEGRDIAWYGTNGKELADDCWEQAWQKSVGMLLNGKTLAVSDAKGAPVVDDTFLVLLNSYHEGVEFLLPPAPGGGGWQRVVNTENMDDPFGNEQAGTKLIVGGRALVLMREAGDAPAQSAAPKKRAAKKKTA